MCLDTLGVLFFTGGVFGKLCKHVLNTRRLNEYQHMLLDPYSYVAPSRVKIFLCPCGHIKRSLFLQYAERLAKCREVRLVDVTPDGRADRGEKGDSWFDLTLLMFFFTFL